MEKNPIKRLLAYEPMESVIVDMLNIDGLVTDAQISEITSNEKPFFSTTACKAMRRTGVGNILTDGAWLILQRRLVINEKGHFNKFLESVGFSSSQAYRSMNVVLRLGRSFAKEPELLEWFVPEGAKILCEANINDGAREDALDLARQKQLIDIKTAQKICKKHGVKISEASKARKCKVKTKAREKADIATPANNQTEPTSEQKLKSSKSKLHFFVGSAIKLFVESRIPNSKPALQNIIADVRSYLSKLEEHYAGLTKNSQRKAS